MKKQLTLFCCILVMTTVALSATSLTSEEEAVKNVIETAYLEGFQNLGGREMIEAGFHPTFVMVLNRGGNLVDLPLDRMIEITEQRQQNPEYQHVPVIGKFLDIDVTSNAAMVKLELWRDGKLLFTDYLGLYKFDNNWKIFNKLYHQH